MGNFFFQNRVDPILYSRNLHDGSEKKKELAVEISVGLRFKYEQQWYWNFYQDKADLLLGSCIGIMDRLA